MCITIPQSVQDYCIRPARQREVNALMGHLATGHWLPPDIDWYDLRKHYKDLVTTATVRTDYAVLLLDVWDATWGPTLAAREIIRVPIQATARDYKPSPSVIWNDGLYRVYYDPRDANYWLYVETIYKGPNDGFQLYLWHGDQNDQATLAVDADLGDRWVPYIPDTGFGGWFVTKDQAFLADQTGNEFDPEPMREAAKAALDALLS